MYFGTCHGNLNQKWISKVINGKSVIASRYILNGQEICLTVDGVGVASRLYGSVCTGANNQEMSLEQYSRFMFANNELKYQARISQNIDGTGTSIVIPWQSSPVFQFNADQNLTSAFTAINNNTYTLKLEDGKSYFISTQAKDRSTTIANTSAWSIPVKITVDTLLPQVSNLKTTIKDNKTTITATIKENNFKNATIELYNGTTKVRTIANCNGVLCNRDNIKSSDGNYNLLFDFDGKGDNGADLTDSNYRVEVVVSDLSNNFNPNSSMSGGVIRMDTEVNGVNGSTINVFKVSNSAPIFITSPFNNIWVNGSTIDIKGSVGRVNSSQPDGVTIAKEVDSLEFWKEDLDGAGIISTGSLNNLRIPLNSINNFDHNISLDLGKNSLIYTSYDKTNKWNQLIGDPATTRPNRWTINREDIAPEIKSIKYNGLSSPNAATIPVINESKATIDFTITDPMVNSTMDYTSGMNSGTNPKGYNVSLLRSLDGLQSFKEIPLYANGTNISDPNPNPRLTGDLVCTPINT